MKVSKVRECRAVLTDTLELRFCRVCGAYSRFSTIAAVTQPDLRAASIYIIYTIWWAYFTITLWSPDLCKAVILDVGWSTIQSQFLRKPYLRLTDSPRSVILIVFYFISLGRVIEMWICWHYELWFMFVYRQHCDLCCAMGIWWFVLWPQITNQRPCTDTWVHPQIHYKYTWYICIYIYPFKMGLWDTSRGL